MQLDTYFVVFLKIPGDPGKYILGSEDFDCCGVEEYALEENDIKQFSSQLLFETGPSEQFVEQIENIGKNISEQKFFFYGEEAKMKAMNFFNWAKENDSVEGFVLEKKNEDWMETWRSGFKKIEVTDDLSIVPSWEPKEKEGDIHLYPGMGFGTGEHETTYLCLLIFMRDLKGNSFHEVLDFGCGSGILGICAMKQGFSCDFMDIDEDALVNTRQNLKLNQLNAQWIESSLPEKTYDLIFANILYSTLVKEKENILSHLKKDGHLILSGILTEQFIDLMQEYSDQCIKITKVTRGDWVAVLLKKVL